MDDLLKEPNDLQKTMDFLTEVVRCQLLTIIAGKKFKGTITIELNCIDGGIGNVSTMIKRNYNKNEII